MEVLGAIGIMGALWYGGYQVIAGACDPGRVLLLHHRGDPALRAGPPALAYGQYHPAIARARWSASSRSSIPRTPSRTLPAPTSSAGSTTPSRSRTSPSATPTARSDTLSRITLTVSRGRDGGVRGDVRRGQDHSPRSPPSVPRRHRGRITVDGHDVREVTVASLRALYGHRDPGNLPLPRFPPPTTSRTARRGHREEIEARGAPCPRPRTSSPPCPRATPPRSASGGQAFGRAAPAHRHRAGVPQGPAHPSSWTRPPPTSTRRASSWCSRRWASSPRGGRCWSSPTGWPPSGTRTAWWWCTRAHRRGGTPRGPHGAGGRDLPPAGGLADAGLRPR